MMQDIMDRLGASFPFESVEAKVQVTTQDKKLGMVVFYLDSRAIQQRLDAVVGMFNWSNHFSSWHDNSQICGISIFNKENGEWVTKHDGAENSKVASIKGGLTDAFKRAAVLWGIGRYLYQIDGIWVEVEQKGNSSVIKENQQPKIRAAYDAAVKRIFGAGANQPAPTPAGNTSNNAVSANNQNQPANNRPAANQLPAANTPPANNRPPAQPAAQNTTAAATTQPAAQAPNNAQQPQSNVIPIDSFKIQSIKPSGGGSQLLELCDGEGEITSAYVKSGEHGIALGAFLRNVKMTTKNGTRGKYNILDSYDIAA